MAKVYSMHMIALKHGATPEEFERFFRNEWSAGPGIPGITWHLLRGDRGDRAGRYLLMGEIESVEKRNYHFPIAGPGAGQVSPEVGQAMAAGAGLMARWDKMATMFDIISTDYVDVA